MKIAHTVPAQIDFNIQKFCRELVPSDPFQLPLFVPVKPEEGFEKAYCFMNVYKKAQKDGGYIVLGWDITNASNKFLEAEYHAVWQSPSGDLIDVTPPQLNGVTQILFLIAIERADVTKGSFHPKNRKFIL